MRSYIIRLNVYERDDDDALELAEAVSAAIEHSREALEEALSAHKPDTLVGLELVKEEIG